MCKGGIVKQKNILAKFGWTFISIYIISIYIYLFLCKISNGELLLLHHLYFSHFPILTFFDLRWHKQTSKQTKIQFNMFFLFIKVNQILGILKIANSPSSSPCSFNHSCLKYVFYLLP